MTWASQTCVSEELHNTSGLAAVSSKKEATENELERNMGEEI
jgi:hypothetical protein